MVAALLLSVWACSREQPDWRSAESADTLESYGQFIDRHPDSELVTQARTRIAQLGEDRDWRRAGSVDTADAYKQFLAQHASGKWAQEARIRIESFALGAAPAAAAPVTASRGEVAPPPSSWADASPAPAVAATPGVARAEPTSSAASAASVPATVPAGYGIQLGAFSSEDRANSEWRALQDRFGPQLQGLAPQVVSAPTAAGPVYRLQVQTGEEARARAICEELKRRSQPCVPVVPH